MSQEDSKRNALKTSKNGQIWNKMEPRQKILAFNRMNEAKANETQPPAAIKCDA